MKVLFLVNQELKKSDGISNKIYGQLAAFKKHANQCYFSYFQNINGTTFRKVDDKSIFIFSKFKALSFLQKKTSFGSVFRFVIQQKINLVYIRYNYFASPFFIFFLWKLKQNNVKVVLEIPTYPYDAELPKISSLIDIKGVLTHFTSYVEKLSRRFFVNVIDNIASFTNEQQIFGVDVISISNAVDPKLPLSTGCENSNVIRFVGVASLAYWHGYDRAIASLAKYDHKGIKKKVEIHIVGASPIREELEDLTTKLGLEDNVIFHGQLNGHQLDKVMNKCDIGIDSLGRHRSGIESNNSLKSKEYLMRGMPFIKSHIDESVDSYSCSIKVSADDEIFDFNRILQTYEHSNFKRTELRALALSEFTWDKQISLILAKFVPFTHI